MGSWEPASVAMISYMMIIISHPVLEKFLRRCVLAVID